MLAERPRLTLSLAFAFAGAAALAGIAFDRPAAPAPTMATPAPLIPDIPGIEVRSPCPANVRAILRLGDDATVLCARGSFGGGADSTFALGFYNTTESWERMAVFTDDGRLIVTLTDRPTLASHKPTAYVATDLEGDGVDEIVGRTEIIHVDHDTLRYNLIR